MLIKAAISQELSLEDGAQVYIPEGSHTITPSVDGKPKEITVNIPREKGEEIAATLQTSLELRKETNPIRTIFDFDHNDTGPAAAIPTRFFYEEGKGIMIERELTRSGKLAIEGRDYSYFSPTFLVDEDGTPAGVPESGPIGALVNDPAFREIPRIAAKEATKETKTKPTEMNTLVTCGLLSESEGAKDDHMIVAAKRVKALKDDTAKMEMLNEKIAKLTEERDKMKDSMKEMEASQVEEKKTQASNQVAAAVAKGQIPSKDKARQDHWTNSIMLQGASAVKELESLPVLTEGVTNPVVSASQGDKVANGGGLIEAANKLVAAGKFDTQEKAIAQVAASNPALYDDYLTSLTSN